jgi:peroxiredoxin
MKVTPVDGTTSTLVGVYGGKLIEDRALVGGALYWLADPRDEARLTYGVWQQKSFMGRKFMGIVRTTYLIGPDGKVKERWDNVKVDGHVDAVAAALRT